MIDEFNRYTLTLEYINTNFSIFHILIWKFVGNRYLPNIAKIICAKNYAGFRKKRGKEIWVERSMRKGRDEEKGEVKIGEGGRREEEKKELMI
jgi:hypothetical protein